MIDHALRHREEVILVDRDPAREGEALAVVPGELHRVRRRERTLAPRGPASLLTGHRHRLVGGGPADVDEIGVLRAQRRQQHDLGALGIDGLAIGGEPEVVEVTADQGDRAVELRRIDADTRARRQHLGAQLRRGHRLCGRGTGDRGCLARRGRWR